MGFVDVFYYGQNKLICKSLTSADNGKTVSITNSAGRSWSGTIADKKCEFMLPPRDVYSVSILGTGGVAQNITEILLGYGECRTLTVGYDKNSAYGIKQMLKAGVINDYFEVGDQIMVSENGQDVAYDVLHIGYKNGNNIIFGRHDLLSSPMKAHSVSSTKVNPMTCDLGIYLDGTFFESLSQDFQDNIADYEYMSCVGGDDPALRTSKIWLPLGYNVMGEMGSFDAKEVTVGGAAQFSYFAVLAHKIKSMEYWTWSGLLFTDSYSTKHYRYCTITTTGSITNNQDYNTSHGVLPCFMIDDQ